MLRVKREPVMRYTACFRFSRRVSAQRIKHEAVFLIRLSPKVNRSAALISTGHFLRFARRSYTGSVFGSSGILSSYPRSGIGQSYIYDSVK